jgi:hypothetical protein
VYLGKNELGNHEDVHEIEAQTKNIEQELR